MLKGREETGTVTKREVGRRVTAASTRNSFSFSLSTSTVKLGGRLVVEKVACQGDQMGTFDVGARHGDIPGG